jgi:regulator of cell morphogenesis and NO signaling
MASTDQVTRAEEYWRQAPLDSLIERLLRDHQSWRVKDFPMIEYLFDRLEDTPGPNQPTCLVSLRRAFYRLRGEMEGHMSREENVLFPAIIDAQRQMGEGLPAPKSAFGSMQNPISILEDDHEHDERLLAAIRAAAHGYQAPETADENVRILFRELQALEAAMHAHTHLESSILFARALKVRGR